VLVKAPAGAHVSPVLAEALACVKYREEVTVSVDVDPVDLL
jgi:primosomal protein N'